MTSLQGKGVQAWVRLANEALSEMPREKAMEMLGLFERDQLAAMMLASSAAGVAVDGDQGGNLLYEIVAERLTEERRASGIVLSKRDEEIVARRATLHRQVAELASDVRKFKKGARK